MNALSQHQTEVRDLTLDIISEGHDPVDAAEAALSALPAKWVEYDPDFVSWLSNDKLVWKNGRVARVS